MSTPQKKRPEKDRYYLDIAKQVSARATCFRAKVGAIIVRDDQIVSTGYNGAPRKTKDCFERGNCFRDKHNIPHGKQYESCRSVHAEQNCIINAARAGVSLLGGDMYMYLENRDGELMDGNPCFICKKMIINAGLNDFISFQKDGSIKKIKIEEWVKNWQKHDIIDDKDQYGKDYNQTDHLKKYE